MAKLGVTTLALISILVLISARNSSFEDCPTRLSVLETALYQTGNNLLELNEIFYPPNKQTSRFIRVEYSFQNEAGEMDNCNISYIWAIGGFLLIQPPTIFQFTSLFFNYPNNDLETLGLYLPYQCRPLINTSSSNCKCLPGDTHMLNVMTQQIATYAKTNGPEFLTREHNYARAVCASELQKHFYSSNKSKIIYTLLCLSILFPFFIIIVCTCICIKVRDIAHSLSKPSKHGTTVAMSLIGVYVSFSIYVMDILACHSAVTANHEYKNDIEESSINVTLTIGTLICDTIFLLPLISGLFICLMKMCDKKDKCTNCLISLSDKLKIDTNTLIFLCMLVSPLLCFSSHVGFILMAWLTEPTKSTTVFIIFYLVFVYLYLVFRECYRIHVNFRFPWWKEVGKVSHSWNQKKSSSSTTNPTELTNYTAIPQGQEMVRLTQDQNASPSGTGNTTSDDAVQDHGDPTDEESCINVQAFCLILLVHSIFIVGIPIMIALAFILVPLETAELVTYIFHLFKLLVVLVSTIFIYKLFFTQKFNIDRFLKVFHKKFNEENKDKGTNHTGSAAENDTEKTGKLVAQLTHKILKLDVKATS